MEKKAQLQELKKATLLLIKDTQPIFCPALGTEIHIDRLLYRHIVTDKDRPARELWNRLKSVPPAFELLSKSNFCQKHSIQPSKQIEYWTFTGAVSGNCVEILVRQVSGTYKQAYSIVFKGTCPVDLDKKFRQKKSQKSPPGSTQRVKALP